VLQSFGHEGQSAGLTVQIEFKHTIDGRAVSVRWISGAG
jgi:hypothetical protein